jgi:tetratricopeptide (TPR) repeat protein
MITDRITETQGWMGLEIHHHADDSKPRSGYMPLLAQSVVEDPYDDRNAFYYARELYFYGQYEEAEKEFKRHLSLPRATWKPERAASMRYIAKLQEDYQDAITWFSQACSEAPDRREGYVDIAKLYYEHSMWTACLQAAERALEITVKPLEYLCEEFAWGSAPWDYAAIAAFNLGNFEKALQYGSKAVELNPSDPRLANNLTFYSKESLSANSL